MPRAEIDRFQCVFNGGPKEEGYSVLYCTRLATVSACINSYQTPTVDKNKIKTAVI
jgi:hypothetical protein